MAPTMMIQGASDQVRQLLQQLLTADLPVTCVVVPERAEEAPTYQPLVVASALCARLTVRLGTAADYGQAQWLVLLDQPHAERPLTEQLALLRRLTSRVLENGFQGQFIFAGDQDQVFTYFAWKFSGIARERVWGLGTAPLGQLLTARLAERLAVSPDSVRTTVIGQASEPIVAWSRTYVGPIPILMYLANADGQVSADDLSQMETWLQREATGSLTTLRLVSLISLLRRLLAHQAPIISVTHPQAVKPVLAASSPVLVTPQGLRGLTDLSLAEGEQQAYQQQLAQIQDTIAALTAAQTEGK